MAKQSIATLKNWFKKGLKPLESQFADLVDSFFHKDAGIPIESVTGLQELINTLAPSEALDSKLNISDYNDRFKGRFTSLIALQTAHPTANAGDYAQVDSGSGEDVVNYNWDDEDGWIEGGSGSSASDTDMLPEGSTNKYFTDSRALSAIPDSSNSVKGKIQLASQAEANGETDTTKAITAKTLAEKAVKSDTFNPVLTFTQSEKKIYHNQAAAIALDADFTGAVDGAMIWLRINGDAVNSCSFNDKFDFFPGSEPFDNTKMNHLTLLYDSVLGKIYCINRLTARNIVDVTPPTITGVLLASNNSYIDVFFSEGVYASGGITPVISSLLALVFNQNAGTATNCVIASIKKNNGSTSGTAGALTGGENVIRVFLTVTGSVNGSEFISIKPTNGTSIYDHANNAMSSAQTTGNINLRAVDLIAPTILGQTIPSGNAYIDIQFSEGVFTDIAGTAPVLASDFTLSFSQNAGTATAAAITSVTKNNGGSLIGGETIVRINLSITGVTTGAETITITPASGSSIYDASGNAMSAGQTTGAVNLNNQSYSAAALAVFALMPDAIPDSLKVYMAEFIDAQVTAGNWATRDIFQYYAMNTINNALIDWKGNALPAVNFGATWNSGSNFQFNGTSSYLDSKFNPGSIGTHYSKDDANYGVGIKEWNETTGSTKAACGTSNGTGQSYMAQSSSNVIGRTINSASSFATYVGETFLSAGNWLVRRTSSTISKLNKNGAEVDSDTLASNAETTTTFFIGARRGASGSADLHANCKITHFHAGGEAGFDDATWNSGISLLNSRVGA